MLDWFVSSDSQDLKSQIVTSSLDVIAETLTEKEDWLISVVDVVELLTNQPNSRSASNYWKVLKYRLSKEGAQLVTICNQLKLPSHSDGKMYKTDVATTKQMLRIIQSIPSPKAEPLKMWLAG